MNIEPILTHYDNTDERLRGYGTRAEQIEFVYTKKLLDIFIQPSMSVLELGCATGYYGLYLSERCQTYHGVDLSPKHIELFRSEIARRGFDNISAAVGDALYLPYINDDSYDAVLVFGPMYHLPRVQRQHVIEESKRICKPGGTILLAYINKIGAYVRVCLDEGFSGQYPNKSTNDSVLIEGVDDVLPDVFFYTTPEEIQEDAAAGGLKVVRNAGVDFVLHASSVNAMSYEKYAAWTELMDAMFQSESCTGLSNHAVLVCQK